MPGFMSPSTPVRTRLRQLNTLACILAALAALTALGYGHLLHGTLLMLGAVSLVPGSIWGRRHRQHKRRLAQGSVEGARPSQIPQLKEAA